MRKIIPFLGELYIYDQNSIAFIKTYTGNGFELDRDPLFLKRFDIELSSKSFGRNEAATYLLMALVNDLHKIAKDSDSRIKKWKYHFSHVNSVFSEKEIPGPRLEINEQTLVFSILSAIVNLSSPSSSNQATLLRAKLKLYIEILPKAEVTLNFIDLIKPLLSQENVELFTYFIEYTASIEGFTPLLTEPQFDTASSQIEWVILRLIRQGHTQSANVESINKLRSFKFFVERVFEKNSNLKPTDILEKIDAGLKVFNP
ncbi:MAG: hypothetical protein ABL930_06410 [Pseudobdellovibrio sp.]